MFKKFKEGDNVLLISNLDIDLNVKKSYLNEYGEECLVLSDNKLYGINEVIPYNYGINKLSKIIREQNKTINSLKERLDEIENKTFKKIFDLGNYFFPLSNWITPSVNTYKISEKNQEKTLEERIEELEQKLSKKQKIKKVKKNKK